MAKFSSDSLIEEHRIFILFMQIISLTAHQLISLI